MADWPKEFFDFAFIPDLDAKLNQLADEAE